MTSKTETIVLGGGCFWCTEAVFKMIKGVASTTSGYSGGETKNPTYERVSAGTTGHAEVNRIVYDPAAISLEKLLGVFFTMHDPTALNGQGNDIGTQYRSVVFYETDRQRKQIEEFIKKNQKRYDRPIVTEVKKCETFYPAEDYHQNYLDRNPLHPYCMLVIRPKIAKVKKEFGDILK